MSNDATHIVATSDSANNEDPEFVPESDEVISDALLNDPEVYEAFTACMRPDASGVYWLVSPDDDNYWLPVPSERVGEFIRILATLAIRTARGMREREARREARKRERQEILAAIEQDTHNALNDIARDAAWGRDL